MQYYMIICTWMLGHQMFQEDWASWFKGLVVHHLRNAYKWGDHNVVPSFVSLLNHVEPCSSTLQPLWSRENDDCWCWEILNSSAEDICSLHQRWQQIFLTRVSWPFLKNLCVPITLGCSRWFTNCQPAGILKTRGKCRKKLCLFRGFDPIQWASPNDRSRIPHAFNRFQ